MDRRRPGARRRHAGPLHRDEYHRLPVLDFARRGRRPPRSTRRQPRRHRARHHRRRSEGNPITLSEQHQQIKLPRDLEARAKPLAHSTRDVPVPFDSSQRLQACELAPRDVPVPFDSYTLLGELTSTVDNLEQVCRQLAAWHARVLDGTHYQGEDERGDGATGTVTAAAVTER